MGMSFRAAIFESHILTLDVARFFQALPEGDHSRSRFGFRQSGANNADHRHRRLLRARREWPRGCRSAEKRDDLAPLHLRGHSITSSARASTVAGISIRSDFAVFRLTSR